MDDKEIKPNVSRISGETKENDLRRLQTLRDDIRAGIESGPGVPADQVLDRLAAKYRGSSV